MTNERIEDIFKIFQRHFRSGETENPVWDVMQLTPRLVLEYIERNNAYFRIGTKWSMHAKLEFEKSFNGTVSVELYQNFDPSARTGKRYEQAQQAAEAFNAEIRDYLASVSPRGD